MAMHFDLVDLRLMVHIADANSMTRGAELSFISLPAASTRIKNLEEGIGTKLLYRTSQGVTLTPPGQALVTHARRVLGQLEHLRGDMQEYVRGIKGHVRVFANTTSLGEFLPPVLRQFLRLHPDVNIDLRERLSHDIVRAVTEGRPTSASWPAWCAPRTCRPCRTGATAWCWWCRAAMRCKSAGTSSLRTRWSSTMWA